VKLNLGEPRAASMPAQKPFTPYAQSKALDRSGFSGRTSPPSLSAFPPTLTWRSQPGSDPWEREGGGGVVKPFGLSPVKERGGFVSNVNPLWL